jgi:hypothetical protein
MVSLMDLLLRPEHLKRSGYRVLIFSIEVLRSFLVLLIKGTLGGAKESSFADIVPIESFV